MKVEQGVGGDAVEGQDAGGNVHVHRHPVGGAGGGQDGVPLPVAHRVSGRRAAEAPGLVVPPEQALVSGSPPRDAPVAHRDVHRAPPLRLPVAAARQRLAAQQLAEVEPLRVIRIRLLLADPRRPPPAGGQLQPPVRRVPVQKQLTEI